MSLADILNTDVEVVGAKLREGVSWWLDELRAIAAPLIERRRKRRPSLAAERRGDGQYILQRPGQPEEPYAPGRSRLAVALILPATMVLVRSISGLFLSERDIRRMIALDLDRLTPFRAEAVYQSVAIEPIDKEKTERHARLGVAPRSSVDQLLTDAKAAGLDPVAVIIPDAYAWLDLAPDIRTAGVALGRSSPVGRLWLAIGLMFALNLGVAIWRDAQATERLHNAVAIQQPLIERIEQMRRELINRQTEDKAQRTARVSGARRLIPDASRGGLGSTPVLGRRHGTLGGPSTRRGGCHLRASPRADLEGRPQCRSGG